MKYKHWSRLPVSENDAVPLPEGRLFEKLVTIAIFKDPFYAYLTRTFLDAEGIESFVTDQDTCSSTNLFSRAKSGYRIRVKESQVAKAVNILKLEIEK
jgi:hypothetical protein